MSNQKALAEKDKGNAAFKAGDYPTAIGHYTSAMIADKKDPTYPLNRAAAYLKLGKNEDAERDCTTVLGMSKNNVKAMFRRGQARVGTGNLLEAQKDFSNVLLIEPSNKSAQEEIKKLTQLIIEEKAKKSKAPSVPVSLELTSHPKRRRIPIKIIDPANDGKSATALPNKTVEPAPNPPLAHKPTNTVLGLEAVSTRSLKSVQGASTANSPSPSSTTDSGSSSTPSVRPLNFKDAKQARETTKLSHIGGGIFRASGENTVFPPRTEVAQPAESNIHEVKEEKATTSALSSPLESGSYRAPSTLFDLTRTWNRLSSPAERWRYFSTVAPGSLANICQTSLEPAFLSSVLDTFEQVLANPSSDDQVRKRIRRYLDDFANVPRFGTMLLFLSKTEKEVAKKVWNLLGVAKPGGIWGAVA